MKPSQVQGLTQDISIPQPTPECITESQFSSSMPYLEGSDQTDVIKGTVVVSDENKPQNEEDEKTDNHLDQEEILGVLQVSLKKDMVKLILLVL